MLIGHKDPEAMARCLVTYIDDDRRIQRAIGGEFMGEMALGSIAKIRAKRRKSDEAFARGPRAKDGDAKGWDWTGSAYVKRMQAASDRLVTAISQERGDVAR